MIRNIASGVLDHPRRHVQMKRRAQFCEMRPLRQRLEMVDRLPRLDLDDALQPVAALLRGQHEVRKHRRGTGADGRVLLVAGVHARFVLAPPFGLQQANNAVVLELLADRPHEDRAHQRLQRVES